MIRDNQGEEANYSLGEGTSLHEDGLRKRAAVLSDLGRHGEALSAFSKVPDMAYARTDEYGARDAALKEYEELFVAAMTDPRWAMEFRDEPPKS